MAEPSDRYPEPWYGLDRLRRSHDLGFDPGRGEEQVDDCPSDVFTCEREPDGRQAPRDVLFDRGDDTPTAPLEVADESLGVADRRRRAPRDRRRA